MNSLSLYWKYTLISLKGQMQYRMSFLLSFTGQLFVTAIEIVAIWALFDRFGELEHWTLAEVCLLYGLVNTAFAISSALLSGFDVFGPLFVKTGNFDRLLLRPRSVVLQLMGHELALRRVGRLVQGVLVFLWAAVQLDVNWDWLNVSLLLFTMLGGIALFSGLMVVQATISFWTVESLEVMNTLTYGGVQTVQYPLDIYSDWFRKFFTFVVPLACISYFPVLAILGKADPLGSSLTFQVLSPALGFVFLGITFYFFYFGVSKYTSTGS